MAMNATKDLSGWLGKSTGKDARSLIINGMLSGARDVYSAMKCAVYTETSRLIFPRINGPNVTENGQTSCSEIMMQMNIFSEVLTVK